MTEPEYEHDFYDGPAPERPPDRKQEEAREVFREFFDEHREEVFFTRQLQVRKERQFFHWVTERALRDLREEGLVREERRKLSWGGTINLLWHRGYRYPKRKAEAVVRLVEEYSATEIGLALGAHGEAMVMQGFARSRFVTLGEKVRELDGKRWTETGHDLDFVFERDGRRYGVEVKNKLGYMDYAELKVKVRLAWALGCRPVFVVRMVPKTWINEVRMEGGFVLVLEYQLYPWTHVPLAKRIREGLGLPVDAPRKLADGTMARFLRWHEGNV